MKTEKLNLATIKNVLSKSELKAIVAGSGSGGSGSPGGGTGGCVIPCAPTCGQTFVGVQCYNVNTYLGFAESNTCNGEGLLHACFSAGFGSTTRTTSSCVC